MADTNDLKVIVSLDIPKSVPVIEKDLRKLENILANNSKNGKLNLVGRLDPEKTKNIIEKQLSSLKIDGSKLKITPQLDISGSNNNINNSLEHIKENIHQTQQELTSLFKSNKTFDISNIEELETSLRALGASDKYIEDTIKRLKNLDFTVSKLSYTLKQAERDGTAILSSLSARGFDEIGRDISYLENFDKKSGEFVEATTHITHSFEDIRKEEERVIKETQTTAKALEQFTKLQGNAEVLTKKYGNVSNNGISNQLDKINEKIKAFDKSAPLQEQRQAILEIGNTIRSVTVDIGNYEKASNESSKQIIGNTAKQLEQAAQYQRQIETLKQKATDVNSSKPIKWEENSALEIQFKKATDAITTYGNASKIALTQAKIDAQSEIEILKRLVDQTRNAEYAASSLRAKNFDTVYKSTGSDIDKFVQKVQNALGSTKPLEAEINRIKDAYTTLAKVPKEIRIQQLTEVLNQLSNAGSRFDSLKEANKTFQDIERTMSRLDTVSGASVFTKFSSNSEVVELQKRITQLRENYQKTLDVMRNNDVGSEQFKSALAVLDDLDAKFKVLITDTKAVRTALNVESNSTSFTKQVNSLTASIRELQNTTTLTSSQKDTLTGLLNRTELAQDKATLEQISIELTRLRSEIKQTGIESKNFDQISKSVEKVITDLNAMSRTQIFNTHSNNAGVIEFQGEIRSLSDTAKQVKADLNALGDSKAIPPELKARVENLTESFKKLEGSNKTLQSNLRQNDGWARTERQIQTLTARIKEYMAVNTKASSKYKSQFEGLLSGLSTAEMNKDAEAVRHLTSNFQILRSQIKAAGDQGKTFGQTIVDNIKKFSSWMSLTSLIMRGVRSLKQMVTTVEEIDQAMTSLKKVTNETAESYAKFLDDASVRAQKMHSSISDIVRQTEIWVKLGNDLNTASKLAEVSMMYAKVGDVDNESAVKDLVAAMKAFNIESENAIDIVSMLDKLNNEFAVSAKDLGEGLTVTASAMAAGGNSLEKTLSLMTGAGEITQDLQGVSNALRTISMRIRGLNQPLKQLYRLKLRDEQDRGKICNVLFSYAG